ncbi:hypothetical protein [Xanthobacter flavus]|uniref:hypothetical protein n=1 Tax=Xanthobacter flavus TaxID=281 RepID=UPI00372C8B64
MEKGKSAHKLQISSKRANLLTTGLIARADQDAQMEKIPSIKRYAPGDRLYVQAQQIWIILVAFVMERDSDDRDSMTITYGELAERMGYPDRRAGHTLSRQLGIVGKYCKINDIPTLNSIVVNKLTGEPGDDVVLRDGYSVRKEQNSVHRENWFALRVPSTGTFRKVWEDLNS